MIDSSTRNRRGIVASIVGMIASSALSIMKIVIGLLFHSVAIIADGINNLSDAGSSLVTLFGFKLSMKPADSEHPFGHARVEYVTSMVLSFVVLFLGLEIGITSIETLVEGEVINATISMMIVLGVAILVKMCLFVYYHIESKRLDSSVLKAMATDAIGDTFSTLAVLVGTIITYFTEVSLDGYLGIFVAIVIVIGGIKLFKETLSPLLGEKPPKELVDYIETKILGYDGILGIHDLEAHNYGPRIYHVSVHVEIDARRDMISSHELIDEIERSFREEGIFIVIHMDPVVIDDERTDSVRNTIETVLDEIDERITYHDFRVVWGEKRKKVIFDIVIPSDYDMSDEDILSDLSNRVRLIDPTIRLIVDIDRNYIGI